MIKVLELKNIVKGKIIERKNRFVVEVLINNKKYLASNNNTGRLIEYLRKEKECLCISHNKNLKTKFRLIAVKDENGYALIDTNLQMKAFENLVQKHSNILKNVGIKKFVLKRNPRYKDCIFDYLIESENKKIYIELKSAVLRKGYFAMYPDCPTLRGRKHIKRITELKNKGMIIFICALPKVKYFTPYDEGDPEIRKLLKIAKENGVEIKALKFKFFNNSLYFEKEIKVVL